MSVFGDIKFDEREVRLAIQYLEHFGYVVRKPSEAHLPIVLEVDQSSSRYEVGVRLDTVFNGVPYALRQSYPVEYLLAQDGHFRDKDLPKIMADELAYFISDKFRESIATQVKEKITPLVPETKMSLDEIASYVSTALRVPMHRLEKSKP